MFRALLITTLALPVIFAQPAGHTGSAPAARSATPVMTAPGAPVRDPGPAAAGAAAEAAKSAAPQNKSETLHFSVNWPSGLSLGEGELSSVYTSSGTWSFSMKVDAALPGFPLAESAQSTAGKDLCSVELTKESTRGRRKTTEKTTFDPSKLTATRRTVTNDGGKTEYRIPGCARDAMSFVQFIRRELAAGRLPQPQQVYYGAPYQTRVQYVGTQSVRSGNEMVEADKLTASIKGPASELTVELLFRRDPTRTPLSVTIPVTIGKFTVEFDR